MVFVTVGNAIQGFRRLLDAVDSLADAGIFDEEKVFMQTGYSNFIPQHCEFKKFLSIDEFQEWLGKASLIICHGGSTPLQAIHLGKVPIVMARRKKYGEHINDHQVQLVKALAAESRIRAAHETDDLPKAIAEARRCNIQPTYPPPSPMLSLVSEAVAELMRGR